MKSLTLLLLALGLASQPVLAEDTVSTFDQLFGPALAGTGTVIFRVALEKRNGVDMRENFMLKELIQTLEKEGASVRPERKDTNLSFWIFQKNGYFATCDVVNNTAVARYSYAKLLEFFADAPHDGPRWNRAGEDLLIGRRYFSVRILTADDPVSGGRKGEVVVAVLDGDKPVYFYVGSFLQK